jgi:DNA polymerase I
VDLWYRNGSTKCWHHEYDPPFYLYLPDPSAYHEMIDELKERYCAETCTFRTLFGDLDGFSVHADRAVAELIELQTKGDAQLFNVDVRRDQRFMAEQDIFPCGWRSGSMTPRPARPSVRMSNLSMNAPNSCRERAIRW